MKFKFHKIVALGVIFKIIVSTSLIAIFWELKRDADLLSPAHQAAFNSLRQEISILEKKLITYANDSANEQKKLNKENQLAQSIKAVRSVYTIFDNISQGSEFDLSPLKPFISSTEWKKLKKEQDNITGSDKSLVDELNLCIQYMNHDENKQPPKDMVDRMISVEESSTYKQSTEAKQALKNAVNSLNKERYDDAKDALKTIPQNSDTGNCIKEVTVALDHRVKIKNLLLSIQRRIIDDQ